MNNIAITVEEIGMDGIVSMGNVSRSTIYRWVKAINEYCEHEKYDWRVKANYKEKTIEIA